MTSSLLPILPDVYDVLFNFAQSDGFWANLTMAFGASYDVVKATELRQQWQSRNFSQLPSIEVLSDEVLGTANGAYSSSTNKIYLSASFLNTVLPAAIVKVILEEIGHYVDAQVNQVDSAGDEGAIFAELVQGNSLDVATLEALRAENDQTTIIVNGETIQVEQANLTITNNDVLLPSITIAVAPVTGTVNEDGTTNLVYTFTRTGVTTNALTVNYTLGGTATLNTDYTRTGTTNTVTFAAGSATATVTVDPTADTTVEPNETVILTLASGTGYTVGTTTPVTGTITNDDTNVTLAVSPASVTEDGIGNLVYTFTRTGVTSNALTVRYTVGGTATNGTDYASLPTSVIFAAGSATATVTVDPTADTTVEPNETVILTLASGTGYTVGTTTAVTGTITNDDTNVTLAVSPESVTEDGTGNLVYTFTRTGVTSNALTVNYTLGGTATLNTDYTRTGTTNTVTFAAGSATATVTVDPTADTTAEPDETVILTLAAGTGYGLGATTAVTGTIRSDDVPSITLAVAPATGSVNEDGTTNLVYTFTRNGSTTNALTVNYTVGGTATFRTDYTQSGAASFTSTTGTVNFAANATTATVTVNPTADTTVELDETVILTLASGTGYTVGTTTAVTGTITNDDTNVTLAVSPASVTEDGTGNLVYTFTRTGVTSNALTVNYTLGGTATLNTDYTRTGTNNTVTFAAGSATATVTVDPTADTTAEPDETVALTLTSGTGYTVGTTTAVTGTIKADESLPYITLEVSPSSVIEDGRTELLIYTFTRTGPTTNPLTVNYSIGGTATNGTDYNPLPTGIIFAANLATATLIVLPTPDTIIEPDETVALTLTSGTGYTVGTTTAVTGTITDNDVPSITLAVDDDDDNTPIVTTIVNEDGTTNLVYTFTRTGPTTDALTVNYTVGGTAILNTDYTRTGTDNTVTFAAGSDTATVTVDPKADTIGELDETVILTVASGTGYTVGTTKTATGTIKDNDNTPSITIAVSPASVTEDGTGNLVYTFTRTGVTSNALTVNYTLGGTATLNTDYTRTGTNNTVTFAAGSDTATVIIDPMTDSVIEQDETVVLTVASGTGYLIGTTRTATGTITNDEFSQISISNIIITVVEGKDIVKDQNYTKAILTVIVETPSLHPIAVNYTTTPVNATAGLDYTSITGNLEIRANTSAATIEIPILNDDLNEPDEAFKVTLSNPTNAIINPEGGQAEVIITDTLKSSDNRTLLDYPDIENLTLIDTSNINGTGNNSNNIITGNSGNNTLNGAAGIDTLVGGLGNDIYKIDTTTDTITENANEGTDTVQSSVTYTLGNNLENLTLTGTTAINGTGNTLNNVITGNSANNTLNGAAGIDTLVGGLGADIFIFQFGQSTIAASDQITDFAINSDKIDLLTQGGLAMNAPSNFSRAANSTVTTLQNLIDQVFTDANGAITGNQALGVNSAALVQVTTGAIAGTYLVINDSTAGFQSSNDLLINITGFTGTLPALGSISVSNFFV